MTTYNEKPRNSELLTEPAEGTSIDDILEQEVGRELYDISLEDVTRSPAFNSELQLAGIGSKVGRFFSRRAIKAPRTDLLLKQGKEAAEKPPEFPADMSAEDIAKLTDEPTTGQTLEPTTEEITHATSPEFEQVDTPSAEDYVNQVQTYRGKDLETRTWARNINLDYVEGADDIGAVLEANASLFDEAPKRGFKQVEAESENAAELLAPVLQGKQNGLLNDRQLLAGRRLLVSMTGKVNELSEAVSSGAATREQALEFEKLLGQTVMLQKYMQGQIRETGRALASMKINAKTLNGKNTQAMVEAVDAAGTMSTAQTKALILKERMNATGGGLENTLDTVEGMKDKSTIRALANYWAASLLTGPKTQATNFISNAFVQVLETGVIKPMAAGIGSVRRMIPGQTGGVGFDEATYEAVGMLTSFKDATIMAGRAMWEGVKTGEYQSSFGERKIDDIARQAPTLAEGLRINNVSKTAGKAVDIYQRGVEAFSYGLLTGGDEFYKTIAYRKGLYSQATRNAYEKGLRGDDLVADVNKQLNNIDEDLHNSAIAMSEKQTFTNDPQGFMGAVGQSLKKLAQKYPGMKFLTPFINTPVNLFNYALEIGPTAVATKSFREAIKKGGAEADVALAKMSFGAAMFGYIYMLHQEGKVTGGGPKNFKQRAAWDASGRQEYSVYHKGKWIAYNRATDPLGMMIAATAGAMDMLEYASTEPEAQQIAATSVFAMAQYASDATYLQGLGSFFQMVDGNKPFDRYAARTIAGFIPRGIQTGAELLQGDITGYRYQYEIDGIAKEKDFDTKEAGDAWAAEQDIDVLDVDDLKDRKTTYPSAGFWDAMNKYVNQKIDRDELNPLRYWDGEIARTPYIYDSLSPINITTQKDDKANERMIANGVTVTPPKPTVNIKGVRIPLFESTQGDALYDKMLEFVGKARRRHVDATVKSRGFDKMASGPGEDQWLEINRALQSGRAEGMERFVNYLFKQVGQNKEKYGDIALLFDGRTLAGIVRRANTGTLSPDEAEITKRVKFKGVGSREELPVPGMPRL